MIAQTTNTYLIIVSCLPYMVNQRDSSWTQNVELPSKLPRLDPTFTRNILTAGQFHFLIRLILVENLDGIV